MNGRKEGHPKNLCGVGLTLVSDMKGIFKWQKQKKKGEKVRVKPGKSDEQNAGKRYQVELAIVGKRERGSQSRIPKGAVSGTCSRISNNSKGGGREGDRERD
jgi:hypothetical protein